MRVTFPKISYMVCVLKQIEITILVSEVKVDLSGHKNFIKIMNIWPPNLCAKFGKGMKRGFGVITLTTSSV